MRNDTSNQRMTWSKACSNKSPRPYISPAMTCSYSYWLLKATPDRTDPNVGSFTHLLHCLVFTEWIISLTVEWTDMHLQCLSSWSWDNLITARRDLMPYLLSGFGTLLHFWSDWQDIECWCHYLDWASQARSASCDMRTGTQQAWAKRGAPGEIG